LENTNEDAKKSNSDTKQNKRQRIDIEQTRIDWRRSKIVELTSQGYTTERELANKLQVSDSTIHKDFVYLREQTRETFKTHISDRLPSEYERCITGMNQVLKMSWDIANGSRDNGQTITATIDNKTRLQALALVNDCYKYIMDLTTNGVVVTDAIKYVQGKMDHLSGQEKALLQDIKEHKEEGEEIQDSGEQQQEQETHNGVF
jgi:hypothetical protein